MEQNTQNTALLVIDMQSGILDNFQGAERLIGNVNKAIAGARAKNIPVMFVVVGFRNGAPEVSTNNKTFGAGKDRFALMDMDAFMEVHPGVDKQEDEVLITKRRVSAFAGSDLEVLLRSNNITHMALTGVATSGAILSTVREGADRDYRLTVIEDCCGDSDEEVHRVLTTKVFTRQTTVMTVDEWCQ